MAKKTKAKSGGGKGWKNNRPKTTPKTYTNKK